MNDCCSPTAIAAPPKKCKCPVNGIAYTEVSAQTILHHIKHPWQWATRSQGYYFCEDPDCDVVYFGEDGSILSKQDMRGSIGIKDASGDALICYCFAVSRADVLSDPALKEYVTQQTKDGLCSCKTSNPSGRCCLKDFPRNGKM